MNVRYTRRALRHLDSIFTWIAKESPAGATGQITRIRYSTELLGRFPEMGHGGKSPGTLELVVPKTNFIIVYRVMVSEVQVLAVFDGRRRKAKR